MIVLTIEENHIKITIIKNMINPQRLKGVFNPIAIITLINLKTMFLVMKKDSKITKNNKVVPPIFIILKIIRKS